MSILLKYVIFCFTSFAQDIRFRSLRSLDLQKLQHDTQNTHTHTLAEARAQPANATEPKKEKGRTKSQTEVKD